jgi:hypothetical protein
VDLSVLVGARCVAATAFRIRVLGGAFAHDWSTGQCGVTALPCPGCDVSRHAEGVLPHDARIGAPLFARLRERGATHRGLTGVGRGACIK